ncbi:hypothetical protein EJ04DRAFT_581365 [Polyplosphaeria fusca]|uniref:RING-type domain-containing protein n=1 Tax=Polyplosphaeria fusca TaxID=682080 RepID=A0A9P4QP57_9PLEO|nr:hypothetical protein EJ04DRAFT_581365 [Polyplosphaeria fusca]
MSASKTSAKKQPPTLGNDEPVIERKPEPPVDPNIQAKRCVHPARPKKKDFCPICRGRWDPRSLPNEADKRCVKTNNCKHIFHLGCIKKHWEQEKTNDKFCAQCLNKVEPVDRGRDTDMGDPMDLDAQY